MSLEDNHLTARAFILTQRSAPYLILLIFLSLSISGHASLDMLYAKPALFLIALFYWALFAPSMIPLAFTFCAGLYIDIINAYPLGAHALIYCVLQRLVESQRSALSAQPFWIIWGVFNLLYIAALIGQSLLYNGLSLTPLLGALQWQSLVATALCYPLAYSVLHGVHRFMLLSPPSPLRKKRRNIIMKKRGGKHAKQRIRV